MEVPTSRANSSAAAHRPAGRRRRHGPNVALGGSDRAPFLAVPAVVELVRRPGPVEGPSHEFCSLLGVAVGYTAAAASEIVALQLAAEERGHRGDLRLPACPVVVGGFVHHWERRPQHPRDLRGGHCGGEVEDQDLHLRNLLAHSTGHAPYSHPGDARDVRRNHLAGHACVDAVCRNHNGDLGNVTLGHGPNQVAKLYARLGGDVVCHGGAPDDGVRGRPLDGVYGGVGMHLLRDTPILATGCGELEEIRRYLALGERGLLRACGLRAARHRHWLLRGLLAELRNGPTSLLNGLLQKLLVGSIACLAEVGQGLFGALEALLQVALGEECVGEGVQRRLHTVDIAQAGVEQESLLGVGDALRAGGIHGEDSVGSGELGPSLPALAAAGRGEREHLRCRLHGRRNVASKELDLGDGAQGTGQLADGHGLLGRLVGLIAVAGLEVELGNALEHLSLACLVPSVLVEGAGLVQVANGFLEAVLLLQVDLRHVLHGRRLRNARKRTNHLVADRQGIADFFLSEVHVDLRLHGALLAVCITRLLVELRGILDQRVRLIGLLHREEGAGELLRRKSCLLLGQAHAKHSGLQLHCLVLLLPAKVVGDHVAHHLDLTDLGTRGFVGILHRRQSLEDVIAHRSSSLVNQNDGAHVGHVRLAHLVAQLLKGLVGHLDSALRKRELVGLKVGCGEEAHRVRLRLAAYAIQQLDRLLGLLHEASGTLLEQLLGLRQYRGALLSVGHHCC
mmetsp:Transcript_115756/g.236658  ORF Transcript_115756/g.236658 Transcript_115756/m.236658 type:complete len:736 (-) Transcript_115756:53-2260(-)